MSTQEIVDDILGAALLPDSKMAFHEYQADWADYGRAIDKNIRKARGLEQVLTRMLLREGVTSKEVANAIRAYLITGTLP